MKKKRSKWVVCKNIDRKTVPVEIAIVTAKAMDNFDFTNYLKKKRCFAFDLSIHAAKFKNFDLSKLPTVTIRGRENENG